MGRTVPLALASLVGMNAISPRRLYENCNFDQSVPSRHGFHHFWTQYPPSLYDFSATAGRLISCTICRRHGSKSLDSIRRGLQLVGGLLLVIGRTAPLGLVVLGPILVNILAFHIFLQGGQGIAPGLVFSVLEIFLIYAYRSHFRAIVAANALPT